MGVSTDTEIIQHTARFGKKETVTRVLHIAECLGLMRKSMTEMRQDRGRFSWTAQN